MVPWSIVPLALYLTSYAAGRDEDSSYLGVVQLPGLGNAIHREIKPRAMHACFISCSRPPSILPTKPLLYVDFLLMQDRIELVA